MNIDYLFNSNVDENIASQYINYYFYNMVKLSREKKIFYEKSNNHFISIMKDEMDRKLNGSGKLMYCKFVTMGQTSSSVKYEDTYEARFVHAPKVDFTGTEMDILNEIETQITMDDFKII